jgi:steroid 5-alpha reductase family enzyme
VIETALLGGLALFIYVFAAWLLSLVLGNASIMDIFWGPGFFVAAVVYVLASPDGFGGRQGLVLALVALWSLRLGAYILVRNAGHGEDYRYRKWRAESPETFWWRSLFQVFLLQGALCWVISAPLLLAAHSDSPDRFTIPDLLGAGLWVIGFLFEAIGDFQLARFKGDPNSTGKVMDCGLWKYTRHPNYFGEATLWWGYFLIAAATPWGWATAFSPALMTFLLVRVSGAALLESGLRRRREGYEDYMRRTSPFIPWFPQS